MFLFYFITLLTLYSLHFISIFLYLYFVYIYLYNKNNNFLFVLKQNFFKKKMFFFKCFFLNVFKKFCFYTQVFFKNFKLNLFWKPLFKKISYFGFYRNIINNNINKK